MASVNGCVSQRYLESLARSPHAADEGTLVVTAGLWLLARGSVVKITHCRLPASTTQSRLPARSSTQSRSFESPENMYEGRGSMNAFEARWFRDHELRSSYRHRPNQRFGAVDVQGLGAAHQVAHRPARGKEIEEEDTLEAMPGHDQVKEAQRASVRAWCYSIFGLFDLKRD